MIWAHIYKTVYSKYQSMYMKVEVGGRKKSNKIFLCWFLLSMDFFLFWTKKNYFCTLKLLFDWFFFVVSLFSTRTERNYVSESKKMGKKYNWKEKVNWSWNVWNKKKNWMKWKRFSGNSEESMHRHSIVNESLLVLLHFFDLLAWKMIFYDCKLNNLL